MVRSPAVVGNQKDFAITHGFDFPTAYRNERMFRKSK